MLKKFVILFLLVFMCDTVYAKEITVGVNKDYEKLSSALDVLEDGDTIYVYPGEYEIPYNEIKKSFIDLSNNNVTIKGVDSDGKDYVDSDASKVIVYPKEFDGNVNAYGFLYVTGSNNYVEGLKLINYINGLSTMSVMPDSNFGINKTQLIKGDNTYKKSVYVQPPAPLIDPKRAEEFNLEYVNRVAPTYKAQNQAPVVDVVDIESGNIIIPYSNWATKAYNYLKKNNLLPTYVYHDAKSNITREEFIALLTYCYEDVNDDIIITKLADFSDIDNSVYKYEILKGYSMDFVNGLNDKKFGPNEYLTREQSAVILKNLLTSDDLDYENNKNFTFKDDAEISDWAKESVYYCYENGLLSGDDKGKFNPKGNLKNEEAVMLAYNYCIK